MNLPNPPYKGNQIPNQPFSYPEVPATFDRLFGARVANEQLDPNPSDIAPPAPTAGEWVRPSDWLPFPDVPNTAEKFLGLYPVYNAPENFIAVYFEGDYTVDWGDGTVVNVPSGEKAQHSYSWDSIPNSTLTTEGYKQVLVTVTPQPGQDLTFTNLGVAHDNVLGEYPSIPWLDILLSMPNADSGASIVLYNDSSPEGVFPYGALISIAQRVQIINAGLADDFSYLMRYGTCLQVFVLGPNVVTNVEDMLEYCYNLNTIKFQNVSSLDNVNDILYSMPSPSDGALTVSLYLENITGDTSYNYLFEGQDRISKVVIDGAEEAEDMSEMFYDCTNLESVYISNVPNVEFFYDMFEYCYSLKTAVIGDCPSLFDASYMFSDCETLQDVEFGDTPLLQYAYDMFYSCYALRSAPSMNLVSVFDTSEMFYGCHALTKVPDYNTPLLEYTYYMFNNCYSLLEAPGLNTENVDIAYYMFSFCSAMNKVPPLNFVNCNDLSNIFNGCPSLQSAPLTNVSTDIDFSYCLLSRDAIVDIFNGLASASAEIDVSNNYGSADLTPEDIDIAVDKGWTVSY